MNDEEAWLSNALNGIFPPSGKCEKEECLLTYLEGCVVLAATFSAPICTRVQVVRCVVCLHLATCTYKTFQRNLSVLHI